MAIAPLTYLEQKWATQSTATHNQLHDAASTTSNRKSVPDLNRESFRNVSTQGRITLANLGRKLYTDSDIVRGTVNDIADLSTNNLQGQYWGGDKAWGDQAEALLEEHDKICDVRGQPYNMRHWLRQLVISHYREGDLGTVLVENEVGYPFLQTIAPHRIGNSNAFSASKLVEQGPWKGLRYVDGVILNKFMFPVAYRVFGENAKWADGHQMIGKTTRDDEGNPTIFSVSDYAGQEIYSEVSSRSMMLSYLPAWTDQVRGVSELGTIAFTMQDVRESRALDLLGGKLFAARQFVEYNETGEGNQTQQLLNESTVSTTNSDNSETLSSYRTESINGLEVTYFQAKSGSRIEPVVDARPTSNRQEFEDRVVRSALYALGWSFDFAYNPTKVGGAPMRVVVDRINRRAKAVLNDLVIPYYLRFTYYRLRKFIKLGLLPENADWWKWSVGGFDKITADAKYDADVDIMEMAAGIKTQQQCTAERNGYWQDTNIQKEAEAGDKLTRAKSLATTHGVTMDVALALMGFPSKTGNMPLAEEQTDMNTEDGAEDTTQDSENFKAEVDSYGVAVRAGAVTPTSDDEAHFRSKAGLPPMNADVKKAWSKDENVRRPITLVPAGGKQPAGNQKTQNEDEAEDT